MATDKINGRSPKKGRKSEGVTRRGVLTGTAAAAGLAIGAGAVKGFPSVWAQDIKDITLRHLGVSYSVVQAVGDQAAKDLGFKVSMQNLDTSSALTRFITQPNTVDIPDLEGVNGGVKIDHFGGAKPDHLM